MAMPILDQDPGQSLEHKQLRRHPKHKATWDRIHPMQMSLAASAKALEDTPHFHTKSALNALTLSSPSMICELRPQKADPYCTQITLGGDRIRYPGDCGTKTGSLETIKLLLNSVLSTSTARFASFDISNFFLGSPLDRPEYARIKLTDIPGEGLIQEYGLQDFAYNGNIYFEVTKGLHGLKQAGKLANDLLTQCLETHGYYQCTTTPGLWRHKWRPIIVVLIVHDFGIQYTKHRHAEHLLHALQEHYTVTTDWTGTKFAGIDIRWDYTK
eukprot:CCRYP_007223-RA/>CCRYP_007223-RA protein AED:0.40 eAED:0.40 QI:0/0/0/1/0/0/2/0/269